MERISRRRFLEDSLLALGAAAVPAVALGEGERGRKAGPNDRIRVAIIGVNGRGMDHVKELGAMNDVEIVYICDADTAVMPKAVSAVEKQSGKAPQTVQDMRRIFDDKTIDAV